MSLLSTDITKVKRLSLREIKPPAPELRVDPITSIQVDRPPTVGEIDKLKLIAQTVVEGENSYKKEEIIAKIIEVTKVSQERAEIGFNLILKAGAIEQTINPELYYLGGSIPF
jgi:ribosomal protein S8E